MLPGAGIVTEGSDVRPKGPQRPNRDPAESILRMLGVGRPAPTDAVSAVSPRTLNPEDQTC
jgi:hypothetical protein